MPEIQVLDQRKVSLGKGDGQITPPTAAITRWIDKAGLRENVSYTLKSKGKEYSADCNHVAPLPATFINVV
jgi:hypothetical protein